jgi:hypothetical protein
MGAIEGVDIAAGRAGCRGALGLCGGVHAPAVSVCAWAGHVQANVGEREEGGAGLGLVGSHAPAQVQRDLVGGMESEGGEKQQ